jgi:hypothetical protein
LWTIDKKSCSKAIRSFEKGTRLTKSGQILSLDLIELFGVTYKQPDGRIHPIFLEAGTLRSLHPRFFEWLFQKFGMTHNHDERTAREANRPKEST